MFNLLFSKHYLEHRLSRQYEQELAGILPQAQQAWTALKQRWQKEKNNLPSLSEAELERQWIRPLLNDLWGGDNYLGQLQTRGNQPDMVLYPDKASRDKSTKAKSDDRYEEALVVGEAEKWAKDLDKPEGTKKESPHGQIRRYLGLNPEWGVLTNGKEWRLYSQNVSSAEKSYYGFDLQAILEDGSNGNFDAFHIFFFLFQKAAFPDRNAAIQAGSNQFVVEVGSSLHFQVFDALEALMTGWYEQNKALPRSQSGKRQLYDSGVIYLYRLLFIFYAESRNLLPTNSNAYQTDYSLTQLIAQHLTGASPIDEKAPDKTWLFTRLSRLFTALDIGDKDASIAAYNGGLFKKGGVPGVDDTLLDTPISNQAVGKALRALAFVDGDPVDYYDLAIQQLGAVYEGLLEQTVALKKDEQGKPYVGLSISRAERRALGGFYTPDDIAEYIVARTLEPLVLRSNGSFRTEQEILNLRVVDPAMGSGQFVLHVLDYLADAAARSHLQALKAHREPDENMLAEYKREIALQCIYGVDINPLAVELAKLGIWLATAAKDKPLSFLDHHLRCGNSLIGANPEKVSKHPKPKKRKIDAVPQLGLYEMMLRTTLPKMISEQVKISEKPAKTVEEVRKKQESYDNVVRLRHPFDLVADVWTAVVGGTTISESHYSQMLTTLGKPPEEMEEDPAVKKTKNTSDLYNFFHWGLAFPEVFYPAQNQIDPRSQEDEDGKEGKEKNEKPKEEIAKQLPGFDAVVGNPPYVRQELIRAEKPYLKSLFETYTGVADLYVYFFEQSFSHLLRSGGQFGVICSNKFMKAGYGEKLRGFLSKQTLYEIIDFGDSPVFPDAITYPVIIIAENTIQKKADHTVRVLPSENIQSVHAVDFNKSMNPSSGLSWDQIQSSLKFNGWSLVKPEVLALINKLNQTGILLGELANTKMNYGIKTGLNDAFVITDAQRNSLIQQDANSADLIKPWIRGRDIKRWRVEAEDLHIIFTRRGTDINKYPAIKKHLAQWKRQLTPKTKRTQKIGRKPGSYEWFEIQDNVAYWEEFGNPKIVWPHFNVDNNFSYDEDGMFGNDKTYIIPNASYFLLGVLNSNATLFLLEQLCPSVRGNYMEYRIIFMEQLPIPDATSAEKRQIETHVKGATQVATKRHELHQETRHRFFDLDSKKTGKLNQALDKWWEFQDFTTFQAAIKTAFKVTIPVTDRQSWEDYLHQQQNQHQILTNEIIQHEQQINALVYKLFDLTQSEIQLIQQTTSYNLGAL